LLLQRGAQALFAQTDQTTACNRVHELEERLARWLLMCHNRVEADDMPITHEFPAMMLGTRRSSVTVAAGMLHKAGLAGVSIKKSQTLAGHKTITMAARHVHLSPDAADSEQNQNSRAQAKSLQGGFYFRPKVNDQSLEPRFGKNATQGACYRVQLFWFCCSVRAHGSAYCVLNKMRQNRR
jgi:hypothetical protein